MALQSDQRPDSDRLERYAPRHKWPPQREHRGFVVTGGSLSPGETVKLAFPTFAWAPLAGGREFKVIIAWGDDRPEQRLPEPVAVRIHPRGFSHLEAVVPPTHGRGQDIGVCVTARDEFDNRARYSGTVRLVSSGGEQALGLASGIGTGHVRPTPDGVTRVRVRTDDEGDGQGRGCVSNPSVSVCPVSAASRRPAGIHRRQRHSQRPPGGSAKEPYPHWGGMTALWANELTRRDVLGALPP